ncbi:MAG: hypothetical protein AB8G11_18500 [Saprospiraceae bacterium]
MKNLLTVAFTIVMVNLYAQVNITFQVDMTGQTISADGVHIAGSLNGWSTTANPLTHQGGNLYAVTIALTANTTYEFKYLNGNAWGTEEDVPLACENSNENRAFDIADLGSSIDLPMYDFGTCTETVVPVELTFFRGKALENSIELTW